MNEKIKKIEYSIVIPVYNEKENLPHLNSAIFEIFRGSVDDFEILYVDDKSTDGSQAVLRLLAGEDMRIRPVFLKRHMGQSAALFFGFKEASGNWIITLDADMQVAPSEIARLLPLKDRFDMIEGVRRRRKDSFAKVCSSRIARCIRKVVLFDDTPDIGCPLKLFKYELLPHVPFFINFHRFFSYLVKRAGFRVHYVEVQHTGRRFGKSKYGILDRFLSGIFDLTGVFWLSRRIIKKNE
jgi:glycosyltransferase involved in cell wall biosynthesis